MDGLELLKKDWQKKGEHLPKLSYDDIYQMKWKKSSSIVKWLFYISIGELLFWIILNTAPLFFDIYKDEFGALDNTNSGIAFSIVNTITFVVIAIFIYFLYKSYKAISVVSNIKALMESILSTRKIINYYVIFNLFVAGLSIIITFYYLFTSDPKTIELFNTIKNDNSELKFWIFAALFVLMGIVLLVGFIWLFYRLIYGILLKRLKENYTELKQLKV